MITTREMVDDWRKWYLKEGHTVKSTKGYYNYIKLYVGDRIEINQKTIDSFRENHYNGVSSAALKNFFLFLTIKKQFPREILSFYYGKNKTTKKFPEGIKPIEAEKLINAIPNLKDKLFTLFLYELALRLSEGLKITFSDFNWVTWLSNRKEYGELIIKKSKRGKSRRIYLRPELMEMIYSDSVSKVKNVQGIPLGTLVFDYGCLSYMSNKEQSSEENFEDYIVYAETKYYKMIQKVSKETLGKRVHPHQLRHTKSQFLLDNGMSLEGLKLMLGHEKISTTEIYAQVSPQRLKKELKDFDTFKESQVLVPVSKRQYTPDKTIQDEVNEQIENDKKQKQENNSS